MKDIQTKEELDEAGICLFKVKISQPRNKGLLRMMEDPEIRRNLEKTELSFYQVRIMLKRTPT